MASGDVTQGRRVDTVRELYDGPPGGYLVVDSLDDGAEQQLVLWVKDPSGHVGRCGDHQILVHDDGTVTVWPSILSTVAEHGHDWHGFLEAGVWREV